MKKLSKAIMILPVAISFIVLSNIIYGEETHTDKQEPIASLYNPNEKEQSLLFTFLQSRLHLESIANYLKQKNYACDFCELQSRTSVSKDYLPESLKKFLEALDENNCDLCAILEKLPFKDLHAKLLDKLEMLSESESHLDENIASEINTLLETTVFYEKRQDWFIDIEQIDKFKILYTRMEELGNFPNILDKISIFETANTKYLKFKIQRDGLAKGKMGNVQPNDISIKLNHQMKEPGFSIFDKLNSFEKSNIEFQKEQIENEKAFFQKVDEINCHLAFALALVKYEKFLEKEYDTLRQIEKIADNDFQIEAVNPTCEREDCKMRKIDALSEIVPYAKKLVESEGRESSHVDLL